MSWRGPLWFCYECHAEMRPYMIPDPHCASCNGTFIEKIENPEDDPRDYQQAMPGGFDDESSIGMDFFLGLRRILDSGSRPPSSGPERTLSGGSGRGTRMEYTGGRNGGARVISIGGSNTLQRPGDGAEVPTMSQFLRRGPEPRVQEGSDRAPISGPMMAQYLIALLNSRFGGMRLGGTRGGDGGLRGDPFAELLFGGLGTHEGGSGRFGDYVFNQEALDQIISQLMENSDSGRPVPATDEIIQNLPREVLQTGSRRLHQDCAVCKDQFKLNTDDPDEQIVITLPCTHSFHEGCILPWIKSSGTCPVCRHALVPQPEYHAPNRPAGASGGPPNGSAGGRVPRSPGPSNGEPGSSFSSFFGSMESGPSNSTSNRPRTNRSRSNPAPRRRNGSGNGRNFPGGWYEDVD